MKKLLLFLVIGLIFSSCITTRRPSTRIVVKPTYKRVWYKPWYGPRHYVKHPPRRRHR